MDILGPTQMMGGGKAQLPAYYYPMTNTAMDPTDSIWRTSHAPAGYIFIPYTGVYCDAPITSMQYMFQNGNFNDPDIATWDISSVTSLNYLFLGNPTFNVDIGNWDTSSVTNMGFCFTNATSFNQDLSGWCVSNILSKPSGFDTNTPAWVKAGRQPIWGTCP